MPKSTYAVLAEICHQLGDTTKFDSDDDINTIEELVVSMSNDATAALEPDAFNNNDPPEIDVIEESPCNPKHG